MKKKEQYQFSRAAGVLMPVSSFPSPFGIGTLGKGAYDFIDWLDANPTAISEFSVWLTSVFEAQSGLVNKDIKPEETTVDEKN